MAVMVLTVIAIALIAGTMYLISGRTAGIVDAFRPTVKSHVVLRGTIERMREEGKLVVLTADVTAVSESSTDKRIFFDLIDAGRTTVMVRAPARVQYVVPLDAVSRDDFFYDPETRRLLLTLPNPRLDTAIVEVSTDPSRVEVFREIGWLRLDAFSGRYNEDRARRLLREAAIGAGHSGDVLTRAQAATRERLTAFLEPLLEALDDEVRFEIAFYQPREISEETEILPTPSR